MSTVSADVRFDAATLGRLTGLLPDPALVPAIFAGLPELNGVRLGAAAEQAQLAEITATIEAERFRVIGRGDDQAVWQRGWGEVAAGLTAAPAIGIESLKPQYFHNEVPLRFDGSYLRPQTDFFEYYAGIAVRRQLLLAFAADAERIVELGCGTGLNLLLAADLFAHARLAGTDWAEPTLEILATLGRQLSRPIGGQLLDFFSDRGWDDLALDANTVVLTCHALEQLGDRAAPVVERLIAAKPQRCLHIEPILDFYDPTDPIDAIGARYHQARGYLIGLRPLLHAQAAAGAIQILAERRVKLGNLYHEAYSYLVWEPMQ